jgi:hypothetical protein
MTIRTKVTFYAGTGDSEGVIRVGTVGVEKNRIVRFYDVSGKYFVGFSRQDCLENRDLFACTPGINDHEVSVSDVLKVIEDNRGVFRDDATRNRIIAELMGL